MTERDFEAFKRALENYPSQDNEGYRPDRGSFKSGFLAGLAHRDSEINAENARLREVLEEISKPPYKDSDLQSLMAWVNARARAALD